MKRYAAHLLFLSPTEVYKQYVVELMGEEVVRFFPLTEELESTIWLTGTIVLKDSYAYYTSLLDVSLIADLPMSALSKLV
ncbi:MAG: hypothetical protein RR319_05025 [Bacteroides sp.]